MNHISNYKKRKKEISVTPCPAIKNTNAKKKKGKNIYITIHKIRPIIAPIKITRYQNGRRKEQGYMQKKSDERI